MNTIESTAKSEEYMIPQGMRWSWPGMKKQPFGCLIRNKYFGRKWGRYCQVKNRLEESL